MPLERDDLHPDIKTYQNELEPLLHLLRFREVFGPAGARLAAQIRDSRPH